MFVNTRMDSAGSNGEAETASHLIWRETVKKENHGGRVGIRLRLFPSIALRIPTAHNFTRD